VSLVCDMILSLIRCPGFINVTHPASAQRREDFIWAEASAYRNA